MMTKTCKKCGQEKSLDDFEKMPRNADGYTLECKTCRSLYKKQVAEAHRLRNRTLGDKVFEGTKLCKMCGVEKPRMDFMLEVARFDGVSPYCKPCTSIKNGHWDSKHPEVRKERVRVWGNKNPERKEHHRRSGVLRRYGLTNADYDAMLLTQGGRCAICGSTDVARKNHDKFCVDHDHATGKIRSLLCTNCNVGIGSFKDDPNLLQQALDYLRRHDGTLPVEEDWDSWFTRWVS